MSSILYILLGYKIKGIEYKEYIIYLYTLISIYIIYILCFLYTFLKTALLAYYCLKKRDIRVTCVTILEVLTLTLFT